MLRRACGDAEEIEARLTAEQAAPRRGRVRRRALTIDGHAVVRRAQVGGAEHTGLRRRGRGRSPAAEDRPSSNRACTAGVHHPALDAVTPVAQHDDAVRRRGAGDPLDQAVERGGAEEVADLGDDDEVEGRPPATRPARRAGARPGDGGEPRRGRPRAAAERSTPRSGRTLGRAAVSAPVEQPTSRTRWNERGAGPRAGGRACGARTTASRRPRGPARRGGARRARRRGSPRRA